MYGDILEKDCPFTGYIADEYCLYPLRKFIERPYDTTFSELLRDCLENWVSSCNDDVEWSNADEQVDDSIIANEYEFDKHGNRWG